VHRSAFDLATARADVEALGVTAPLAFIAIYAAVAVGGRAEGLPVERAVK
jgi:hypothetical protein